MVLAVGSCAGFWDVCVLRLSWHVHKFASSLRPVARGMFVCLFFCFCYRRSIVKASDKRILLCFGRLKLVHWKPVFCHLEKNWCMFEVDQWVLLTVFSRLSSILSIFLLLSPFLCENQWQIDVTVLVMSSLYIWKLVFFYLGELLFRFEADQWAFSSFPRREPNGTVTTSSHISRWNIRIKLKSH